MKITFRFIPLLIALSLIATVLPGCKQEGCTDPDALNYDPEVEGSADDCEYPVLSLHFHTVIGDTDFALNQVVDVNGVAVEFTTLQYYISGIRLMNEEGNLTDMLDNYLLVKADQMMYELGEISTGHKHMLAMNLGIDSVTNHLDPTTYGEDNALAPQSPSMHWSWDAGYIFFRIDGQVDTDGDGTPDAGMEFHLGKDAFLTPLMVMSHSDADEAEEMIEIELDVAKLFEGIDLSTDFVTHTGDFPELAETFAGNISGSFGHE